AKEVRPVGVSAADKMREAKAGVTYDPQRISWSSGLLGDIAAYRRLEFRASMIRRSAYRPSSKQVVPFDNHVNARRYQ
ncbi:hypothetical protein LAM20_25195, partial [Mycobacterium tuberculosis]|nr:hypothetical protein [Mycobacterium tuberculosis]